MNLWDFRLENSAVKLSFKVSSAPIGWDTWYEIRDMRYVHWCNKQSSVFLKKSINWFQFEYMTSNNFIKPWYKMKSVIIKRTHRDDEQLVISISLSSCGPPGWQLGRNPSQQGARVIHRGIQGNMSPTQEERWDQVRIQGYHQGQTLPWGPDKVEFGVQGIWRVSVFFLFLRTRHSLHTVSE